MCRVKLTSDPLDFNKICIFPLKKPFGTGSKLLDVFHHLLALPLRKHENRNINGRKCINRMVKSELQYQKHWKGRRSYCQWNHRQYHGQKLIILMFKSNTSVFTFYVLKPLYSSSKIQFVIQFIDAHLLQGNSKWP